MLYHKNNMQAMDENIEAIRADRLMQVQIMDGLKFHTLRRKCLDNMTERAMMLDSALQDVVIDGINRTEDIVWLVSCIVTAEFTASCCDMEWHIVESTLRPHALYVKWDVVSRI